MGGPVRVIGNRSASSICTLDRKTLFVELDPSDHPEAPQLPFLGELALVKLDTRSFDRFVVGID